MKYNIDEVERLIHNYNKDPKNSDPDNQKVAVDILAWAMLENKK